MNKFIQTHFLRYSTFPLSTKQNGEKVKNFLSSHFSILPPFSILPLFYSSNQTDPNDQILKSQIQSKLNRTATSQDLCLLAFGFCSTIPLFYNLVVLPTLLYEKNQSFNSLFSIIITIKLFIIKKKNRTHFYTQFSHHGFKACDSKPFASPCMNPKIDEKKKKPFIVSKTQLSHFFTLGFYLGLDQMMKLILILRHKPK